MARPSVTGRDTPSAEKLRMLLRYDSKSGKLFWNERDASSFPQFPLKGSPESLASRWNKMYAGKEVGGTTGEGYKRCTIDDVHYQVHRIIWKMVHGNDPIQIDHVNGNKSDNRIDNLRDVSQGENSRNRKFYSNNTSGVMGVSFHKRDKVWNARIGVGEGKEKHLGSFSTMEEAIAARVAAETLLDYHQNHGRKELNHGVQDYA